MTAITAPPVMIGSRVVNAGRAKSTKVVRRKLIVTTSILEKNSVLKDGFLYSRPSIRLRMFDECLPTK